MGLMLTNHASIGMWSVFKEPEVYLLPDKPNNYHRLCPILKESLGTVDPVRWIHLGDYREGVYNLTIGYCWDGDTDLNKVELPPNIVEFERPDPGPRDVGDVHPRGQALASDWDTWEYHGGFYNLAFEFAKVRCGARWASSSTTTRATRRRSDEQHRVPAPTEVPPDRLDVPLLLERPVSDHGLRPLRLLPASVPGVRGDEGGLRAGADQPDRNPDPYIIGREKVYDRGTSFTATVWVTNDFHHELAGAAGLLAIVRTDSEEIASKPRPSP